MHWIKKSPVLGAVLLLALLLLGAEGYLVQRTRLRARRTLDALETARQEHGRLARLSPAPSESNEGLIGKDLRTAEQTLADRAAAWNGGGPESGHPPVATKSVEAYFDLATFIEQTRTQAARAEVQLKPDEHFGFGSHAGVGPEPDLVPAVVRQRAIVQYLLEALFKARPHALIAVQRERPLTAAQRTARNRPGPPVPSRIPSASGGGKSDDFFDWTGLTPLRAPGQWEGEAFRLEFSGQTNALRTFLNTLASSSLPLIVRSVEVEPAIHGSPGSNPALRPVPGAAVPLIGANVSKFVVLVEYLVPVPEESAR